MKIVITIKDKNLDRSVKEALKIGEIVYNKYHLKICKCKCLKDGTSVILQ